MYLNLLLRSKISIRETLPVFFNLFFLLIPQKPRIAKILNDVIPDVKAQLEGIVYRIADLCCDRMFWNWLHCSISKNAGIIDSIFKHIGHDAGVTVSHCFIAF